MTWTRRCAGSRRPVRSSGRSRSALLGNAAEVLPELLKRNVQVDVVTDQTSAHDALGGYIPAEISLEDALALRKSAPEIYTERSMASMATHCEAMLEFQQRGAVVFDYGNNLRGQAFVGRSRERLRLPRLRARLHSAPLL